MLIERGSYAAALFFLLLARVALMWIPGLRVTSYLRPRDFTSQHSVGTALDVGVATPAEREAAENLAEVFNALRERLGGGFVVVRELDAPGGPHYHFQLFDRDEPLLRLA